MKRVYFFEVFVAANLAALLLFASATLPLLGSPLKTIWSVLKTGFLEVLLGVGIRSIVAFARGEKRYFAIIRTRRWLVDTLRLTAGAAFVVFVYGWIKLIVPILHPALCDEALWDLDRILFFGISPTVFVLDLFRQPAALRFVDWCYANIFFASIVIAAAYFLSDASRRIRVAFANGYAVLWIVGAWLYLLLPSLGPAYRFPEIWMAHGDSLRVTQTYQTLLMRNYQNVLRAWRGEPHGPITIVFGIGAFPSLHVAFQAYVFFWMRRVWTSGEVLFGVFVVAIFLGSMITGWHYAIDGIAGLLLAFGCYRVFARRARLLRWLGLRKRHPVV